MPDTKQYFISLPGFEDMGRWDVQTYEKKKHDLFKKYPDAQIFEFSKYNADEEQGENDYYHIQLDGLEGEGVWDAKTFAEKKDKLFQKYPNAQVYRSRGVDYWYDKALADEESIKTMKKELEALTKEEYALPEEASVNPYDPELSPKEYEEFERQYTAHEQGRQSRKDHLAASIAETQEAYDANPRVIEANERYKAEQAAALEDYNKNYLPNLRNTIIKWSKDDLDLREVAKEDRTFNMDPLTGEPQFASLKEIKSTQKGGGLVARHKMEQYQSALAFLNKAERIRNEHSSFGEGMKNTAMNWMEAWGSQSDIQTYQEIYVILKRLEDRFGTLDYVSEDTLKANLTKSEQALILAFFEYSKAQAEIQDDASWIYEAGGIAAEAIPFVLEFIATGGLSSAASKGATKGLAKALTSWIKGATKGSFRRTARKVVAKGVRGTARGLTQAAIITPLRPTAYTNVTKAMTQIGEDGKLKDSGSDIAVAIADEYIETLSELSGGAITSVLGGIGKGVAKKFLSKGMYDTFATWGEKLSNLSGVKLAKSAQFHGLPVEIAEEYFGNALREMYDAKALDHMHEGDNFWSMFFGFMPLTVIGGGLGIGQYVNAQNKVNKGAKRLRDILAKEGYENDQINSLLALEGELSPYSLAEKLDPVLTSMAAAGASKESRDAVIKYGIDVVRLKTLEGTVRAQDATKRQEKLDELTGKLGTFYQTKNEGTQWQENVVTQATLYDGRTVFLTSAKNEMGEYAAVDAETGAMMPVSESDIAVIENTNTGESSLAVESLSLDSYLTSLVMGERKAVEEARMADEENTQIAALQERLKADPKVNIGTSDAPVIAVFQSGNANMAEFVLEDGSTKLFSWREVGDYLNQPIRVLTDEQLAEAEAAEMEVEEAMMRTEYAETNEEMDKADESLELAEESEEKANPVNIPMNPDGTVNTDLFWDQNPEEWVKWNDQQRQDNGVDSMAQIAAGLQTAEAKLAEASKLPFATPTQREARDKEMGFWQDKINRYNALLEQYQLAAAAEEAQMARAYAAERLEAAEAVLADKMTQAPKRSDYRFTPQYMQAKQKYDAEVASLQEEVTRWQNELAQYGETPVQQDEAVPVENVSVVEEQQPEEVAPSAEELAAQLDAMLMAGASRSDEAVVTAMQTYADAIASGVPAQVVTRKNVMQVLKDAGVSETKMAEVKGALRRIQYIVNGFEANGVAYMLAEEVITSEHLRGTYVHERQHIMTAVSGIDAALMTMTSREELQEAIAKLTNSNFYNGKGHMVLADELISMAMERAYKGENLDEVFEQIGFKNENAINFIKDIDNAQRNDSGLSLARVAGIGGNAAEGGSRQDGRTEVAGSSEVGEQGPRSVGRGGEAAGDNTSGRGVDFSVTGVLEEKGLGVDEKNGDVRFSVRYTPTKAQREAILGSIMAVTGRTREDAEKWLNSELSLAAMVGDDMQYLDYPVDSKYKAIKDNSDYPQGTVDFNNICRKRLSFTKMFTRLQRRFPNRVFTADELADIRGIMSQDGLTVACGLCYVEDRRQMVGEVANSFITEMQNGFADYASENATKRRNADKFLALIGEDAYVPSIYELTTQEGADKLYNEHRGIWEAFQAFNNARGQQSQNLLQGYAEYKREILSWSDKKVKSVNDNGGLRIFSYSDFEAHHLLDIVQIIIDCASKGVKIQGYTKVPAFARAVANTGIKLNRSLIPLGDTGIVDGQLAFDPVEGIDVNDPDFLESNDNVGNILIGINDVQIRMAMADPRIHYIIPYHARQKENIRRKLNVGEWVNYISTQNERNLSDGKRVKDNVNIYTEVLTDDITNDRQFVEKYLQLCKEKGRIPKFDQFLNKDAEGNYIYTPGYYKFLVDFKLFDENGNILPQQPVVAEFDDAFNMQILEDYVKGEKESTGDQMNETYDKIVEAIGLDESAAEGEDIRFSARTDEQRQALFDKAKAQFGLTNNFNAAGYMLPDGSLLDFSEANDGGNPNQRSQDHREIEGIIMDEGTEYDSRWMYLADFMNEGAIRLLPEYAGINLMKAPTKEQRQRLFDFIYKYNGEVILEIADERLNNVAYVEYDRRTSPSRIFRDIDGYFNEGIVPQQDTRFSASNNNQEIFVSNAAKAVEGIKQEKATPAQWLAMLEKNGGLKAAEDKWMGLSDWLKGSDKKTLTKAEVLDFINENMIVIEETHYSEAAEGGAAAQHELLEQTVNKRYKEILNGLKDIEDYDERRFRAFDIFQEELGEFAELVGLERYGVYLTFPYEDIGDYIEMADAFGVEINLGNPIHETRLSYTTDGLDNRREIALTVPTIESWNERDDLHFGDAGDGRAVAWIRFGDAKLTEVVNTDYQPKDDVEREIKDYIEYAMRHGDDLNTSIGYAYNQITDAPSEAVGWTEKAVDNVAKGMRGETIETAKVLVIDEIQSNRHQEGREKGYRQSELQPLLDEKKRIEGEWVAHQNKLKGKFNAAKDRGERYEFTAEEIDIREALDAKRDEIEAKIEELEKRIPAAPFEKNWHELAMKRMLRYAAENGYDYIAWTKGDQQAERYDIGTIVNSIEGRDYNERENIDALGNNREITLYQSHGETALYVSRADGRIYDYEGVGLGVSVENELLSDVVGKELADKLMADGDVNISNGELSIGGEGMRGFYDKMLPAFMNKYGKKWGVKVEDIDLPNLEDGLTMHSVPVTEEMKASVMEGQTMFSVSTPAENKYTKEHLPNYMFDTDVRFSLSKNNRQTITGWMNKRKDLPENVKEEVLNLIDQYSDATLQLCIGKWFSQGTIALPEDLDQCVQAVASAKKAKVNALSYSNPMEIINEYGIVKSKKKPIDPDTVSTLKKSKALDNGIVIYDVEESEESRKNLREIINTHYGVNASPWCLLQGDENGNLTEQSAEFWQNYSAVPKRVVFRDGKLLAFYATASKFEKVWWDRLDRPWPGIPVSNREAADPLKREVTRLASERTGKLGEIVSIMREDRLDNGGKAVTEWASMAEDDIVLFEKRDSRRYVTDGYSYGVQNENQANPISRFFAKLSNKVTPKRLVWAKLGEEEIETNALGRITSYRNGDVQIDFTDSHIYVQESETYEEDGRTWRRITGYYEFTKGGELVAAGARVDGKEVGVTDKEGLSQYESQARPWFEKVQDLRENTQQRMAEMKDRIQEEGKQTRFSVALDPAVRAEMDVIKATAMVNGNYMKAPNGQSTKLTEDQWALVRTKNFKNWFGDWENDPENASKVVDENGEPMVVYHGGAWRPLLEEKGNAVFKMRGGMMGKGAYFTDNIHTALYFAAEKYEMENNVENVSEGFLDENGYVAEVFLNIRDEKNIRTVLEDTYYLATSPNQIKSATDNTGEFSESEDIRFSARFRPVGGNRGYVGYSMSKRAAEARAEGRFPKTDFKKEYGVTDKALDLLVYCDIISGSEWHHTSMYGNKTTFYGWYEDEYADIYTANKKEVDAIAREYKKADEAYRNHGKELHERLVAGEITPHQEYELGREFGTEHWKKVAEMQARIDAIFNPTEDGGDRESSEEEIRFSVVTDPALLEKLESEPKIKVYRAMQLIDGKLYPPMSAKIDGKMREPIELGMWEQAEERPDLVDEKGNFKLDKGNKTSLKARYNPYFHTSTTPLNDQFSSAQSRPELVTVEVEVPASELTSGYKAEGAKDAVGKVEWKAGVVQGKLSGTREVILSRWDKPIRIVPDSEVAAEIVKMFDGKDIIMPSNVVTPSLRAELEKLGVPFVETTNNGKLLTDIASMETPVWESKGTFENLAAAEDWADKNLKGKSGVNKFTGERISIGNRSVSKMLSEKSQNQSVSIPVHLAALQSVLDFIRTGIPAETHRDQQGRDFDVLRLYNAFEFDGQLYRVKSTVRKVKQGDKYYTYEVQEMELIEERQANWKGEGNNPRNPDNSINSITGANLLKGVKKSNSNELILQESVEVPFSVSERPVDEIVYEGVQKVSEEGKKAKTSLKQRMDDIDSKLYYVMRMVAAAQKNYDKKTVDIMTNLAKDLMRDGALSDPTRGEINRLLAAIKNATGKADLTAAATTLMDVMVSNQLRHAKNTLAQMLKIKAKKVNASGVEVQGTLDLVGQRLIATVKESVGLTMEKIDERIADANEKMDSEFDTIKDNAAIDLVGLNIARKFVEGIVASEAEEKDLRKELESALEDKKAGKMTAEGLREFRKATEDAIRQNRIERTGAYRNILSEMAKLITESVTKAGQFRDAEKERIEKIHHYANSDMKGMDAAEHVNNDQRFTNNPILRFFLKPLATMDQMLRQMGSKHVNGEGYLWNHYMRGWLEATENEYLGVSAAHKALDAKAKEVFGVKRWSDIFSIVRSLPSMHVEFWDGDKMRDHVLTQGNLLYIYMVNKMSDGKMKLRRMGIEEEQVRQMSMFMDPRLIEVGEWLQNEFLPGLRDKYNAVHEKMFGAPMAAIDSYFPIKVLANARTREVDVATPEAEAKASTITGSIIKRTKNSLALDVLGSDALDVVLGHIQEMEHWAAFAEWNRDLNTLLSYKKFRNRVQNMSGLYGSGSTAWKNFRDACEVAAGVYKPASSVDAIDKTALNLAKGVTAGKISFRVFTAIKQLLSMPAFVSDANMMELGKSVATPWKSWNWAINELPLFQKRWLSRQAGDSRLMATESDWKLWKTNFVEAASRYGMAPNAFVDALTVSIGAKAIYETKRAKYIENGYSVAEAEKKAKQDATILFNESQQSNEGAFLSAMQVDRSWVSVALTVFRNSSMGYQRMLVDALRNIKHRMSKGYKEESIEFMAKQMVRDGLSEEQAQRAAERMYNRGFWHSMMRVGTFGFLVQFAWNLGAYLPYLVLGSDDDEKEKMLKDAATHAMLGGFVEGFSGGSLISEASNLVASGKGLKDYEPSLMPVVSDMKRLVQLWGKDEVAAANETLNLLGQMLLGVNPQTLTDIGVAIYDACDGDPETAREVTLLLARILQVPQSQTEQIFIDEIDFTVDKALDLTIEEFAQRYARYKRMRSTPITGWMYSDEEERKVEDRYIKRFTERAEELKRTRGNEEAKAWYNYVDNEYEEVSGTINELRRKAQKAAMRGDTLSAYEFAEQLDEFLNTPEVKRYEERAGRVKGEERIRKAMKDIPQSREEFEDLALQLRRELVEEMQSEE